MTRVGGILEFNLLATCSRNREFEAANELERVLGDVGDERAKAWRSRIKGIVLCYTWLGPFEALKRIRTYIRDKPWEINFIKRVIPIEIVVRTDLSEIREACKQLASRIKESDRYRITVEKRHTALRSREIIDAVAGHVRARVDLENPDKVILIEVIGELTGISLIPGNKGILNVTKELLSLGE